MSKIRAMHVLIDLEIGGTQYLALNLARHFTEVKTHVAGVTGSGPLIREFEACCPTYIINKEKRLHHKSFLWFKPIVIGRLAWLMQKHKIEIVQTHLYPAAIIGRAAAIIARVPVIIDTLHNLYTWKGPKDLFIDRHLSRWTDLIMCDSDAIRFFTERQNPRINPRKFRTIYLGVDLVRFKPDPPNWNLAAQFGLSSSDLIVANVSRFVPQKRVGDLIQASPAILKVFPSVKFLVIGDGPQKDELQNQARIIGVENAFRFVGFRTDTERILPFCHIFTQLASREGFGLAMVEAMACGVPVIAALSAPIPEIVTNRVNGLTIEIGDIEELSSAICLLLANPSLRQTLSRNALEMVHQRFDIQRTANELEQLYQKLLSN